MHKVPLAAIAALASWSCTSLSKQASAGCSLYGDTFCLGLERGTAMNVVLGPDFTTYEITRNTDMIAFIYEGDHPDTAPYEGAQERQINIGCIVATALSKEINGERRLLIERPGSSSPRYVELIVPDDGRLSPTQFQTRMRLYSRSRTAC